MALDKYYYFKLRNGVEYEIKVTIIHINTTINRNYRELTEEQREFYIANPTATVREVVNCQLIPPYVPPTPELDNLKLSALSELRDVYCFKMARYSELDVAMALASQTALSNLWLIAGQTPYTLAQSKDIIQGFCTLGKTCKEIYEEYVKDINDSSTEEELASALQSGKEALNGIE